MLYTVRPCHSKLWYFFLRFILNNLPMMLLFLRRGSFSPLMLLFHPLAIYRKKFFSQFQEGYSRRTAYFHHFYIIQICPQLLFTLRSYPDLPCLSQSSQLLTHYCLLLMVDWLMLMALLTVLRLNLINQGVKTHAWLYPYNTCQPTEITSYGHNI